MAEAPNATETGPSRSRVGEAALSDGVGTVPGFIERRRATDPFEKIFDDNPIAMVLLTADTHCFVRVNAAFCRMLGYTAAELIGLPHGEFAIPEDGELPPPSDANAAFAWHPTDKRYRTKSGEIVRARVRVMRLGRLASGEEGVLVIADDVTKYRQIEDQLRQAQKMEAIGNLTGGMAHDFNNILGIITGNLGIARDEVGDNEDLGEMIGEALEAAWRGADLTRRLLAFARRQPLRPVRIEVNDLIADMMRLLRRLLGEDVEIVLNLDAEVWPVVADPAQLEAALTNLSANARDALPKGGRLIFATRNARLDADYIAEHADAHEGDFVTIEVSDTGCGMPPDVLQRVFEPFFTTKEKGKGTGLGLSMVFGFMRQSGGHVSAYSEPGLGTTFRLYLPRAMVDETPRDKVAAKAVARGAGQVVLVVEDNPAMRRVVLRQLRELGYRVIECERAAAALEMLHDNVVHLLLTDIVMPGGLDGVELARMARERWPSLKVVLTSGFPRERFEDDPFTGLQLLTKPYSKEEFAAALQTALQS